MARAPHRTAAAAVLLLLSACSGGHDELAGNGGTGGNTQTPMSEKTDVSPCLSQVVGGRKVQDIVIPDVVTLNLDQPGGYPNGRTLTDPVVDLTLNAIFLDVSKVPVDTLAKLPLDPSGNDVPYPSGFPYLAPAQGTAPAPVQGSDFSFRTNDPASYTRVDRMGEPAVATALIATAKKTAYNDDSPTDDAQGKWAPTIIEDLTGLTDALRDDLQGKGLVMCATQTSG